MHAHIVKGQERAAVLRNPVSKKCITQKNRAIRAKSSATVIPPPVKLANDLDDKCVNAIRFLAIDGVNKANSGHPGAPMGLAPISYLLWTEIMKFNPKNPDWANRDRFVLSAGHASMLIYSMLYLSGYDSVTMDDLKQFRQIGSVTPGHPENFVTRGVEVTTGPLGQGISNAVGLAAAQAHLGARYNKPDCDPIFDNYTYAIAGDGCMMEGVSNEACSLAGHWGLGNLIAFYDSNEISIDGHTDISFSEDVPKRYEALGWHVQLVDDGNTDLAAMRKAIDAAKAVKDKPSLIVLRTLIGYGSPNKANSHDAHGAPLGKDETDLTREALGWAYPEFDVPKEVMDKFRSSIDKGAAEEKVWKANLEEYCKKYPEEGKEVTQLISNELPEGWEKALPTFTPEDKGLATRQHSNTMINALAGALPGWVGGSADLAPSNLTIMKEFGDFQSPTHGDGNYAERNFRFGVREFGMGAICVGLAHYNVGLIPYCATFFIFTDYMRSAIRMAALSQAGVIFVTTHDSIGLGEDGPTHQPIEHLASFRAMPNLLMLRPCGGNETAGAYKVAVENAMQEVKRPSLMAYSRQGMPNLPGCTIEGVAKGGYIIADCEGTPELIIIGTGSELMNAAEAGDKLKEEGMKVRVVSMPSTELFEEQTQEYKDSVLPPAVTKRVSIEAASTFGWEKYVGPQGKAMGIDTYGSSGPGGGLYKKFGLTTDDLIATCKSL